MRAMRYHGDGQGLRLDDVPTPTAPAGQIRIRIRVLTRGECRTGLHVVVDARYCFPLPDAYSDREAAPLHCAGLIGYRTLSITKSPPELVRTERLERPRRLELYGFGAREGAGQPCRGPGCQNT